MGFLRKVLTNRLIRELDSCHLIIQDLVEVAEHNRPLQVINFATLHSKNK